MARKKSAAKKAREEAELKAINEVKDAQNLESKEIKKKEVIEEDDSEYSSEESSEDEDEYGTLITADVEHGIQSVLDAIKNDPKKLLDKDVKFFDDEIVGESAAKKDKPMYLKDYHRMNLLSGGYKDDDEEIPNQYGTVDGEKPFVVTEREERDKMLSDIKKAFSDDEDESDDGDFLKKKVVINTRQDLIDAAAKADENVTKLPDPDQDQDGFLNAFVGSQAWIPKKNDKVIDLDKVNKGEEADFDEEDFDEAVEKFEHAYNFRYEDENAAEIVSYARNQATLRRSAATNSRKRKRELEQEERKKEVVVKEELLKKKKKSKMNKVMDRLAKIKAAVGDDIKDEVIQKVFGESLLNDDFDDNDWDSKMAQIFDESYYEAENEKPKFDDDLMDGFEEEIGEEIEEEAEEEEAQEEQEIEDQAPKSKKEVLKQKKSTKKTKESIKEKAKEIVEASTLRIMEEVDEERGRSSKADTFKFKYREVSPESYGLNTRDILLADDSALNTYIGIKKFAPYRAKELRMKDKRKYTKRKTLFEWRKETFKNAPRAPEGAKDDEIWIPIEGTSEPKQRKSKKAKKDKKDKKEKKEEVNV